MPLQKNGQANIQLPKTQFENLDFSFSGIKTAVLNLHHKNPEVNYADLCASFEKNVTEVLIENSKKALQQVGLNKLVLAGGVSANSYIRNEFAKLSNVQVYFPNAVLCTDNAAMIASAGYYKFLNGDIADLRLNAVPNLKI